MWPMLLDMTEEESIQSLRHLELEAYASLVSALRAQGSLNHEKKTLLKETSLLLNISNERHKAEVRRAISDEKLNTIAYHIAGRLNSLEDWAQEGRRLVPLLPRAPPQTPYAVIADEASDAATQYNKQLPFPANTERKRTVPQSTALSLGGTENSGAKSVPFRIPEVPKEEPKKRKCPSNMGESSSLAQHLLGTKLTKIQQIYRQASMTAKQKVKESNFETEHANANIPQFLMPSVNTPKINIIQNISIPASPGSEDKQNNANEYNIKPARQSTGDYLNDTEQAIDPAKLCITKKTINKGQKLIVVSNAQTLPTNSILQKTLSVPINKLKKLNLDKFKIVPNNQLLTPLQASKPKLVTIKGSSGKKVIPLSQLQMLNPTRSVKVVPYCGKVSDKSLYKKPAVIPLSNAHSEEAPMGTNVYDNGTQVHGLLENGGKPVEDFESNGQNFDIFDDCKILELDNCETVSSESSEVDDRNSSEDSDEALAMEIESCEVLNVQRDNQVLEEFEIIHTEELLQ